LRAAGIQALALDVIDPVSRRRAVDQVLAERGRIDVLVNNAGIAVLGGLEDTPEDQLRQVMETNFFGPVALTRLVLPAMRKQRSGRIINLTAIGAILCSPFLSAYCASKHAMDAVTCALDVETHALGIRVSSVLPGQYKTALGGNMTQISPRVDYKPVFDELAGKFLQRVAAAEEDLSPVVAAILAAVNDPEPKPRYVVGKGGALMLPPVVNELENIHRIELDRARLA
jgi:NAD(P)-dependent dehydrogenase (short-subunit alcohol dehydrogenase family)